MSLARRHTISHSYDRTRNFARLELGPTLKAGNGLTRRAEAGPTLKTKNGATLETEIGPTLRTKTGATLETEIGPTLKTKNDAILETEIGPTLKTETGPVLKAETDPTLRAETAQILKAEPGDWREDKSFIERSLYMLKTQAFSDTTILVGETKEVFKAHSFVLVSGSSVFAKILSESPTNGNKVITVRGIKPGVFQVVLQYMYGENILCDQTNVSGVLRTAKHFKIYGLIEACLRYLESCITENSVCTILYHAIKHRNKKLEDRCLRYVDKAIDAILKADDFKRAPLECLSKIVPRDSLIVREDDLYDGLMAWAYAKCKEMKLEENPKNARKMLGDVFYQIRFPMMNPQNFTRKISNSSVLDDEEKVELFKYFYGSEAKKTRFPSTPRQWNKRASGILYINPHPDIFSQGFSSSMF